MQQTMINTNANARLIYLSSTILLNLTGLTQGTLFAFKRFIDSKTKAELIYDQNVWNEKPVSRIQSEE
ncbi:hypothetical protein RRG08_056303 [Elysia crispata]|uniref:Uncharacterized protein n=1 Tax=Elysia crispata TaxID=231223 RepID=A0AAE1AX01_9GAST|nr:hypothetical protein RRG08_056303 [Elysia crispata]